MMNRIPQDSFPIRKVWVEIEQAWLDDFWKLITPADFDFEKFNLGRSDEFPKIVQPCLFDFHPNDK